MATVLVVDDSPIDRVHAGRLLARQDGWNVVYACDYDEAMEAIRESPPDLVLTDMQMPEKSGLDVVMTVCENWPEIPVVLMTNQGSEELAVMALEKGAASYVPKRVLGQDLIEVVQRVLTVRQAAQGQASAVQCRTIRVEEFELGNDIHQLMAISRYLQREIEGAWQLPATDRVRVGMALEEALLNAYYHGNLEVSSRLKDEHPDAFQNMADQRLVQSPYRDRRLFVRWELRPQDMEITIRDQGPGFDLSSLPDPTDPEFLERPSGRGVLLMRSFMDEVHYNATGNEVTLKRRRPRVPAAGA